MHFAFVISYFLRLIPFYECGTKWRTIVLLRSVLTTFLHNSSNNHSICRGWRKRICICLFTMNFQNECFFRWWVDCLFVYIQLLFSFSTFLLSSLYRSVSWRTPVTLSLLQSKIVESTRSLLLRSHSKSSFTQWAHKHTHGIADKIASLSKCPQVQCAR